MNLRRITWRVMALAAMVVAIAIATSGCSCARTQQRAEVPEPTLTAQPTSSAEPTVAEPPLVPPDAAPQAPPSKPPSGQTTFRLYLTLGETLSVVSRSVPKTKAVASAAMESLLAAPLPAEKSRGYGTSIPRGTRLRSVSVRGGTATVDLTSRFESGGGSMSMRSRVAQVVYTLTQFPGVKRVAFEIDGKPVEAIGGEGVMVSPPVTRADFTDDVLPAILVESPTPGSTVRSPFRLSGVSNTFEATYLYELTDAKGRVVAKGSEMATSGTGTWGTFSVPVRYVDDAAGPGTLEVFESSPKDGSRINVVEVPVILAP